LKKKAIELGSFLRSFFKELFESSCKRFFEKFLISSLKASVKASLKAFLKALSLISNWSFPEKLNFSCAFEAFFLIDKHSFAYQQFFLYHTAFLLHNSKALINPVNRRLLQFPPTT
jgi:hypothetical protein